MFLSISLFRRLGAGAAVLALSTCALWGQAQPVFDAFHPNADGNVYAVVVQPDGKILIGGGFSTLQPNGFGPVSVHIRLARLNTNGSVDESFQARCNGDVTTMALQADGRILVGGKFSRVWGNGDAEDAGSNRNGLARFNADGTLDATFDPHPMYAAGVDNQAFPIAIVRAIAVQPGDNKILIGGAFGTFASPPAANAPERIARLNADGSIDTTFQAAVNNVVQAIALQPDGKILVGGGFSRVRPTGATTFQDAPFFVRLEANGALDTAFVARPNNRVMALKVTVDNRILVGGEFTNFTVGTTTTTRTFAARLLVDGTVDTTFNPAPNAAIDALGIQADGRVVLAGRFTSLRPNGGSSQLHAYGARVNPDGAVDGDFVVGANAPIAAVAMQADGGVLVGGIFTNLATRFIGTVVRGRIGRVQADGLVEAAFAPQTDARVRTVVKYPDPDGRALVIGQFNSYSGVTRNNIVRIDATGAVDPTFNPVVNGAVTSAIIQPDGKIIIGGAFNAVGTTARSILARLNTDGTLDTEFDPRPNSEVKTIILQGEKIVVGGSFTLFQPGGTGTAIGRVYLARLNANGTVDETFQADCSAPVEILLKDSDTTFVVGGQFTSILPKGERNAVARRFLARVTGDGLLDDKFDPRPSGIVYTLALQGTTIVVGGSFTGFQPTNATALTARRNLGRISLTGETDSFDPSPNGSVFTVGVMPDNTIVIGGEFTELQPNGATTPTVRRNLAWLNQDGTVHASRTFEADAAVWSILPLADGRVMIGGDVRSLFRTGGASLLTEDHVARLAADGTPDPTFVPSVGAAAGEVNTIIAQNDGRLLVGGVFSQLSGSRNVNLTRLTFTGSPDPSFGTQFDGPVHALFVRNPTSSASTTGPFAWLNASGGLRSDFSLAATSQLTGSVRAVLQMPDGKILLGGAFTTSDASVGDNLVRLNADGTLDPTFNPSPNARVTSLALDSVGRILVGGEFTSIFGTARTYFARLTAAGALDTINVTLSADGVVVGITVAPQDGFYLAGDFLTVQGTGATSAVNRAYLARFAADGTLDTAFVPQFNSSVYTVLLQGADRILVGGTFSQAGGVNHGAIARILTTTGAVDAAFTLNLNGFVEEFAVQNDGKILACGAFTAAAINATDAAEVRQYVLRFSITASGAVELDGTFRPLVGASVHSVSIDSQGRILLGGEFSTFTNPDTGELKIRRYVARLSSTGTLDDTFNPQPSSSILLVRALTSGPLADSVILGGGLATVLPEALILAGGEFAQVGNAAFPNLVRLNTDGSADPSYTPSPDGAVSVLAGLPDGRVFVAGAFQNFGTGSSASARGRMAILAADGSLDSAFTAAADGPVTAVGLQIDGQLVIGGSFANVGGAAHANLARVATDGTVDAAFTASTDGAVSTIVVQADGKVIIGGAFTTVNGSSRPYLARLHADGTLDAGFVPALDGAVSAIALQADGGMLVGGAFSTVNGSARARFVRLTSAGVVDTALAVGCDGEVRAILPLTDGRAVIGGQFRVVGNRPRYLVTRIPAAAGATQAANINATRTVFTWTNGGTRTEFSSVRVSTSLDRSTWTDHGLASRTGTSGVWQFTFPGGAVPPADTLYYVRVQATLPSSRNYSTGRFETSWQFFNDQIAGPRSTGTDGSGSAGGGGIGGGSGSGGGSGGSGSGSGGSGGSGGGGSGGNGGGTGGGSSGSATPSYHLTNFSVRARPNANDKLITGFVIRAAASEKVVLRAVGPGLTPFNVAGVMPAPLLQLYSQDGTILASSTAWGGNAALAQSFTDVGAFELDPASADAAQAPVLAPGIYTTHVSPSNGVNGIALAEVYFAGSSESAGGLANLSARGPAGDGDAVLIVGFVVGGDQPRRFLVRGVGPGLLPFNVADALLDPAVQVYGEDGVFLAANDNWEAQAVGTAADVTAAQSAVGAFALAGGSKDAALVLSLDPGIYTAHVIGTTAGTGLVEVYELP